MCRSRNRARVPLLWESSPNFVACGPTHPCTPGVTRLDGGVSLDALQCQSLCTDGGGGAPDGGFGVEVFDFDVKFLPTGAVGALDCMAVATANDRNPVFR
jgi:hypothetical protein